MLLPETAVYGHRLLPKASLQRSLGIYLKVWIFNEIVRMADGSFFSGKFRDKLREAQFYVFNYLCRL